MDFSTIRLEPEYITKYGKPYHVLYQQGKIRTRKEFMEYIKNRPNVFCWGGYISPIMFESKHAVRSTVCKYWTNYSQYIDKYWTSVWSPIGSI